jgi:hypothetical protein
MDLRTPRYERKEGPYRHRCNPPGWWRRWRDGVRPGAIWRCACGERYEFRPWEPYRKGVGRPGQPWPGQPGFPHWWHLFEVGQPPAPSTEAVLGAVLGPAGGLTDQRLG